MGVSGSLTAKYDDKVIVTGHSKIDIFKDPSYAITSDLKSQLSSGNDDHKVHCLLKIMSIVSNFLGLEFRLKILILLLMFGNFIYRDTRLMQLLNIR